MINFDEFDIEEKEGTYAYISEFLDGNIIANKDTTNDSQFIILKVCKHKIKELQKLIHDKGITWATGTKVSKESLYQRPYLFIYDSKIMFYSSGYNYLRAEYIGFIYYDTCDNEIKRIS